MNPEGPGGADDTGEAASDGAMVDEENGLPDVPPLELPVLKAAPIAEGTKMIGIPAVTPSEVPADKATAVASNQAMNGGSPLKASA